MKRGRLPRYLSTLCMLFPALQTAQEMPVLSHPIAVTLTGHVDSSPQSRAKEDLIITITFEDQTAASLQISCASKPAETTAPSSARSTTAVDFRTYHFVFGQQPEYRAVMWRYLSGPGISPDPLFNEHYNLSSLYIQALQGRVDPQNTTTFDNKDRVTLKLTGIQQHVFCDWREPLSTSLLTGEGSLQLHFDGPSAPSSGFAFKVDGVSITGYELSAKEKSLTAIRDSAAANKLPEMIEFCESPLGARQCHRMAWASGLPGYVTNDDLSFGTLVVKRFDSGGVVMERRKLNGAPLFLYTGTLGRDTITGTSVKRSTGEAIDHAWSATFGSSATMNSVGSTQTGGFNVISEINARAAGPQRQGRTVSSPLPSTVPPSASGQSSLDLEVHGKLVQQYCSSGPPMLRDALVRLSG